MQNHYGKGDITKKKHSMSEFFGIAAIALIVYLLFKSNAKPKTKQSSDKEGNKPYTKLEEKTKYGSVPVGRVVNLQEASDLDGLYRTLMESDNSPISKTEEPLDPLKNNAIVDQMMFESLRELLKKSIKHYNEFKRHDYIPKPSLPILFFGDVEQYSKEKFRIVTAALNPSDIEFRETKSSGSFSFFRFPYYQEDSEKTLYISLRDYFKNNPYNNWFDSSYRNILKGLGYSFYDDHLKTLIHTDIVSPLATNPTWSALSKRKKIDSTILNLESIGLTLWEELIEILKPDLILISVAKSHLEKLNLELISEFDEITTVNNDKGIKRSYLSNLYRLTLKEHSCYLLHAPSGRKPFRLISNIQQEKLGEKLKREVIDKSFGESPTLNFVNEKATLSSEVLKKKNFILSKNLRGKGTLIQLGEGQSKIIYDHDLLLDDLGERITELPCCKKYGYYTKSGGLLPKFCQNKKAILIAPDN